MTPLSMELNMNYVKFFYNAKKFRKNILKNAVNTVTILIVPILG